MVWNMLIARLIEEGYTPVEENYSTPVEKQPSSIVRTFTLTELGELKTIEFIEVCSIYVALLII